jgi:hypothetical protein
MSAAEIFLVLDIKCPSQKNIRRCCKSIFQCLRQKYFWFWTSNVRLRKISVAVAKTFFHVCGRNIFGSGHQMSISEKYPSLLQRHFFMSAVEIVLVPDIKCLSQKNIRRRCKDIFLCLRQKYF